MRILRVDVPSYLKEWAGKKDILEMCIELNVSESTLSMHAKELKISLKLDSKVKRMNLVKDLVRNLEILKVSLCVQLILTGGCRIGVVTG